VLDVGDVVRSLLSLRRRDAAAPSLRTDRVGGTLAELGDRVGWSVVFERDAQG
jgi:hypothetical protein